jgi:hypothetical protein
MIVAYPSIQSIRNVRNTALCYSNKVFDGMMVFVHVWPLGLYSSFQSSMNTSKQSMYTTYLFPKYLRNSMGIVFKCLSLSGGLITKVIIYSM